MFTIVRSAALACALGISAIATPVQAERGELREVTVEVADLDLTTTAGQKTLDTRLRAAIRKVCYPVSAASWRASIAARDCRTKLRQHYKPIRDAAIASAHIESSRLGLASTEQ
jgi:UrcA family protein